MTLTLKFVRESDKARLYENAGGSRLWMPRSVVKRTLKFGPPPGVAGAYPEHMVDVADWWLEKNPWPPVRQQQLL